MEEWNVGMLECWKNFRKIVMNGGMEKWNSGKMEKWGDEEI